MRVSGVAAGWAYARMMRSSSIRAPLVIRVVVMRERERVTEPLIIFLALPFGLLRNVGYSRLHSTRLAPAAALSRELPRGEALAR